MSDEYIDPPLGRCVTSAEMAATVREWDDMSPGRGSKSKRLDNPINLSEKIPARPYGRRPRFSAAWRATTENLTGKSRQS